MKSTPVVVALHLVAVFFYLLGKRQNLIGAMFSGKRSFEKEIEPMTPGTWPKLIVGILIAVTITWAVSKAFKF